VFSGLNGNNKQVNKDASKFQTYTKVYETLTKNQAKDRREKELEISKRRLNDQVVIEMLAKR